MATRKSARFHIERKILDQSRALIPTVQSFVVSEIARNGTMQIHRYAVYIVLGMTLQFLRVCLPDISRNDLPLEESRLHAAG